jgi:hypothetical protein
MLTLAPGGMASTVGRGARAALERSYRASEPDLQARPAWH